MSLDTSQKPVNGLETPKLDPPATSATEATTTNAASKNETSDVQSSLNQSANTGKDALNGAADTTVASAGQPLETAKPKEPVEPTKPVQSEEPLPKEPVEPTKPVQSEEPLPKEVSTATAPSEKAQNGSLTAQDTSADDGIKSAEKMDVDSSDNKLPINDPTTIGNLPAKDSEGQDVDHVKAKELASVQETAKHGHDNDQAAVEEQPPSKKRKTSPTKESNGADSAKILKRSASQKKKEPKKATTEDGQPRRSSRLAS